MKIIRLIILLSLYCVSVQFTQAASIWKIYTNRVLVKSYTDWWWNVYKIYSKPSITVITPKSLVYFSGDVVVFLNNENLMDKKVGRISLNTAFIPEDNIVVLEIP